MKFERDSTLGTDTGVAWRAPIAGTLTLYYDSVDATGRQMMAQVRTREVITLDNWLFPEGAGDYQVMEMGITPPSDTSLGQVDLVVMAYNRNAYTDVSDPPGNQYTAVPNSSFALTGFAPVANPGWVLQATLAIMPNGSTLTIAIPDLKIQVMGKTIATAYPGCVFTGVPAGTPVVLYVTDPSGVGVAPTFAWIPGSIFTASPGTGVMAVAKGSYVA